MLTKDEKRKIEEKEQYAAEMRQKFNEVNNGYAQKPVQGTTDNIMSERFSTEMITNVVVPRLRSILEVMNFLKENTAKLNEQSKILSDLEREKRQPYSNTFLTGVIFVIVYYGLVLEDGAIANTMHANAIANGTSETLSMLFCSFGFPIIVTGFINMIVKSLIYNNWVLPNLNKEIEKLRKEIAELEKKVNDYYQTNQELIKFLPERYQNPQSISCILDLFITFRVDSMKEAFNKCEELVKYDKMVSVAQSMQSTLDNLELLHKGNPKSEL